MNLLVQPSSWSCLPTSLAMVLNTTVEDVFSKLGHDGSEITRPDLNEPRCRRGFSIEEIQYVTPAFGVFLVTYTPCVVYLETGLRLNFEKQFLETLGKFDGLLFGTPKGKQLGHVVAWSHKDGLAYDPNGTKYPLTDHRFDIEIFYGAIRC